MTALLDTHVLVWWLNDRHRLSAAQRDVVASAGAESPLLVSEISLWEVAMLHATGDASAWPFRCASGWKRRRGHRWSGDRESRPRSLKR